MNVIELMKCRRSVRNYLPTPVEKEKIISMIEAAQLAPSACNSQCWRFIVTTGKVKEEIVKKGLGGIIIPNRWATSAPVIIVVGADLSFVTHKIGGKLKKIDYYLLDVGIACEHLILRATELKLGTCWIGWFNEKNIKEILKIPKKIKIVSLITVGYPKEPLSPTPKERLPLKKILHWNKY